MPYDLIINFLDKHSVFVSFAMFFLGMPVLCFGIVYMQLYFDDRKEARRNAEREERLKREGPPKVIVESCPGTGIQEEIKKLIHCQENLTHAQESLTKQQDKTEKNIYSLVDMVKELTMTVNFHTKSVNSDIQSLKEKVK